MPSDRDRSILEELRIKNCDLREQLDQEKARNKQILHDKVAEIKHVKEQEQGRWEKEKISLKKKYLKEKNDAVNKILDNLKKKDKGLGDLLNQKDEEIRLLHYELQKSDSSLSHSHSSRSVREQESAAIVELRDQFETEKARLMQSMFELRTEKIRLEEELDIIKDADREKAIQLRQIHDQHQRELVAIKRSSAVENRKQMEEMRQIERRVMDKEKELSRKNKRLSQIEVSKEELQDKLNEQKLNERINLSMSMVDLNSSFSPRKTQEDREKGLQQRNTELQTRVRQLEEKLASLSCENDTLKPSGRPERKRRISLSQICADLEEKNAELTKQNTDLMDRLNAALDEASSLSMDDKPLAEKLRMQEKEKLMIERTLAHLLNQSNIHLPKDVRESIENQALQLELNEALGDEKPKDEMVNELKSKVLSLEQEYHKMCSAGKAKEQQLSEQNAKLSEELGALRGYRSQLEEQLNTTKAVMKTLSTENAALKQNGSGGGGNGGLEKQQREAQNLRNEIEMLRAEKQKLLDGEAATKMKIKLLEEVQMELVKKEEKNSRYYDEVSQKLSLVTKEKKELAQRVEEYEMQRRFEAEEMAAMLNDRNEYLQQLEKDKEYLKKECENYRLSNMKLEGRLQKMEAKISPDNAHLISRINELEEATEVVEALKVSNEDLKTHIRQFEAEKGTIKKQHNEELQRLIRTLDKKNKEHNTKSEELRSHIKRLEADLRNLEHSKMENSGNLQIKAQELQQMSEYVKQLESSEKELRGKLEMYQKSTVNGAPPPTRSGFFS